MKKCIHKNKVYSTTSYSNNNGITTSWICKNCGLEGDDFTEYYFNNEYEATKQKFGKLGSITIKKTNNFLTPPDPKLNK